MASATYGPPLRRSRVSPSFCRVVLDNPGVLLGLMRWRDASINDYRIDAGDRRLHPRGPAS
jgi:hypothetical protein